jgi:hypothetical protein
VPLTQTVQLANREVPVLMINTEHRPPLGVAVSRSDPSTRDELITKAIDFNTKRHQELWELGKIQSFDQHELAFFFDVLNGHGMDDTDASVGDFIHFNGQTL